MFYTLAVLFFGIYLGQEYPQIPSVKIGFQILVANLNKSGDENVDVNEVQENKQENENNLGNENVGIKYFPIKQHKYYSLPIWFSNWWNWSGSQEYTSSSDAEIESKEKFE